MVATLPELALHRGERLAQPGDFALADAADGLHPVAGELGIAGKESVLIQDLGFDSKKRLRLGESHAAGIAQQPRSDFKVGIQP